MAAVKVNNLRAHIGVQHGAQVLTTIDTKRNGVVMHMGDEGVFVEDEKNKIVTFVPFGSIASCGLDTESYHASKEPKRRSATA